VNTASPLSIFPNPATANVHFDYTLKKPSEISIQVVDMYGKFSGSIFTASRNAGYNSEYLDLSNFHPGTYLIILESADGRMVGKLTLLR